MRIGAQLFTVRSTTQTLEGLAETLKKVADIGYKTVQLSGSCAYDGEWMREQLKRNGLECVLTHTPNTRLKGELRKVVAEHETFGCDNIGLGYYSFDSEKGESYRQFVETYLPIAQEIRAVGKYFMYHNHAREFQKVEGKLIMTRLMEDFPADVMGFTLDTYWVQAGGGDPAQWLERLAGRIPCIHLKDFAYDRKMAVIGEGNLNFDRIFAQAEAGGTRYMLVEQDDCNGEDPFACLRRSYEYLKARGFE